jgi:hypothetical protein
MERLAYEDTVIRSFIRDNRLVSIPARDKKREVILRYLVERCFAEDRAYPEPEVTSGWSSITRMWPRSVAAWSSVAR